MEPYMKPWACTFTSMYKRRTFGSLLTRTVCELLVYLPFESASDTVELHPFTRVPTLRCPALLFFFFFSSSTNDSSKQCTKEIDTSWHRGDNGCNAGALNDRNFCQMTRTEHKLPGISQACWGVAVGSSILPLAHLVSSRVINVF